MLCDIIYISSDNVDGYGTNDDDDTNLVDNEEDDLQTYIFDMVDLHSYYLYVF